MRIRTTNRGAESNPVRISDHRPATRDSDVVERWESADLARAIASEEFFQDDEIYGSADLARAIASEEFFQDDEIYDAGRWCDPRVGGRRCA